MSAIEEEAEPSVALMRKHCDCEYVELGVGPLNSQRRAMTLPPADLVIYIGSCGEFIEPGREAKEPNVRLVTADQFHWSPPSCRGAYADLVLDADPVQSLSNLHPCLRMIECITSFTSPAITLDPQLVPGVPGTENMELYGVVPYLALAKQVVLLLGVTNNVGPSGRDDWIKNKDKVAKLSAQFLERHLLELSS